MDNIGSEWNADAASMVEEVECFECGEAVTVPMGEFTEDDRVFCLNCDNTGIPADVLAMDGIAPRKGRGASPTPTVDDWGLMHFIFGWQRPLLALAPDNGKGAVYAKAPCYGCGHARSNTVAVGYSLGEDGVRRVLHFCAACADKEYARICRQDSMLVPSMGWGIIPLPGPRFIEDEPIQNYDASGWERPWAAWGQEERLTA